MIPELNRIHLGDCMDVMRQLPDKWEDLAITDPPYGINKDGHSGDKEYGWKAYDWKGWDKQAPGQEYFKELFRVSKHQIIWGANYFTQFLPASKAWIFWDKGQDLSQSDGELAYSSFNKVTRRVVMNRCKIGESGGFIHPTQKPVALYKWLLTNYAKPGDRILDTHSGSGSLALACDQMGFEFLAVELDPDYHRDSCKRLQQQRNQLKLFA